MPPRTQKLRLTTIVEAWIYLALISVFLPDVRAQDGNPDTHLISESVHTYLLKSYLCDSPKLQSASALKKHQHADVSTERRFLKKEKIILRTSGSFYALRTCYFLTRDSSRIVTASPERGADSGVLMHYAVHPELWDARTGKKISSLDGLQYFIGFSHVEDQMLTSDIQGSLTAWDCRSGERRKSFNGAHSKVVTCFEVSNDARFLVTGSQDSTVAVWDFKEGRVLKEIKLAEKLILEVKFLEMNTLIVTAADQSGKVWALEFRVDEMVVNER